MLPSQAEEKRRKDRISKRLSSKQIFAASANNSLIVIGERQRKQKQRDQEFQEFLGAFEPHPGPGSAWDGSVTQTPTGLDDTPPQSELHNVIISGYNDDLFDTLPFTQQGGHGHDSLMAGSMFPDLPDLSELKESPASINNRTWGLSEMRSQCPTDNTLTKLKPTVARPVPATRNINSPNTKEESRALPTKYQTTLHRAVVTGNVEIVQLLLQHGANVDMRNHVGMTPLHMAVQCGNIELITLLLQYDADLEARDVQGRKAVDLAVEAENYPIVELLISHGTSV